jgi:hypothetical protein
MIKLKDIYKNYHDYDGFVVLHGTDTMSYTASALSFMLENLGKPVVLTGSQVFVLWSVESPEKCFFFFCFKRVAKFRSSGRN